MKQILKNITLFSERAKVHFFFEIHKLASSYSFAKKSEASLFGKRTIFPKFSEIKIIN